MKDYFESLKTHVLKNLRPKEHAFLNFYAEFSQFIRLNGAKVRQIGTVDDISFQLTLVLEDSKKALRRGTHRINLTHRLQEDLESVTHVLKYLREEVTLLPVDPFAQLPEDRGSSSKDKEGHLIPIGEAVAALVSEIGNVDIAGLYAGGRMYRGMANSAGQTHWFSTENFIFDYSLYTKNKKAIKASFAGTQWNQKEYLKEIEASIARLTILEKSALQIKRGNYRTYLEPAAFGDLVQMLSWGGVSEASIQQGDSPLRLLRSGQKSFSPLLSLIEDFSIGEVPRFNTEGELPPETFPIVERGKLVNTWVSSRSAQEYHLASNGAEPDERLRSPVVSPGNLQMPSVLERLDTGLYLSNLHYLNWSDQPGGRITGMTRYACFWVENGKLIAPIENMRFDDTLFHLFGDRLEALTDFQVYLPEVSTYGMRSLGGQRVPGALLSEMSFTL